MTDTSQENANEDLSLKKLREILLEVLSMLGDKECIAVFRAGFEYRRKLAWLGESGSGGMKGLAFALKEALGARPLQEPADGAEILQPAKVDEQFQQEIQQAVAQVPSSILKVFERWMNRDGITLEQLEPIKELVAQRLLAYGRCAKQGDGPDPW